MKNVKSVIKKYFIPHKENDHRPHFLRKENVINFLGLIVFFECIFLFAVYVVIPRSNYFASILPTALVDLTNIRRGEQQEIFLRENKLLAEAARLKATDMAQNGYFSHVSPLGVTPWYWIQKVGYQYSYAGENLAVNFFDSKDVVTAWMNSPSHRENILNNNFTEIGIGVATGTFNGRETIFIVQFFGKPLEVEKIKEVVVELKKEIQKPSISKKEPVAIISTSSPSSSIVLATSETNASSMKSEDMTKGSVRGVVDNESFALRWENFFSQPRSFIQFIFVLLGAIVSCALLLTIFIKIRIQHPSLVLNGFLLLFVIIVMLFLNYSFPLVNTFI